MVDKTASKQDQPTSIGSPNEHPQTSSQAAPRASSPPSHDRLLIEQLIQELSTLVFKARSNQQASLSPPEPSASPSSLASFIDHTLLKPDTTPSDIEKICREAQTYGFATVCVNSCHIPQTARLLEGSRVLPIAVVGFPLGACTTSTKVFETREAIRQGAREIDMVLAIGSLKSGDYADVLNDIWQVVEAARPVPVKVILETSLLNDQQKVVACALSKAAGAAFVKTSTGFGGGGATVEDIALMRAVVGPEVGVKASGGIRSRQDAEKMIAAGANRIGTSSGPAIVSDSQPSTTGVY